MRVFLRGQMVQLDEGDNNSIVDLIPCRSLRINVNGTDPRFITIDIIDSDRGITYSAAEWEDDNGDLLDDLDYTLDYLGAMVGPILPTVSDVGSELGGPA
ncbi:hypothetical protein M1M30_gp192 [Maribacter phage Colly_1]|uniref:Uncharacterized protein n=1 Tax=Maribacter phage Colly_1 TaxID=2745691 RepID=A0A8E4UXZ0_9CAUD|nr:hypothetical protein M1M30_gp192 [Maribacter phage Colly_1]QQO97298.1 hypothetical protein Colly1_192 [Maribacter phage Colly_1]